MNVGNLNEMLVGGARAVNEVRGEAAEREGRIPRNHIYISGID